MKILKWGVIAFVGLALVSALAGKDKKSPPLTQAGASASAPASAPEATATATPEATPEPKPETRVIFDGPHTVQKDAITLRGTVEPNNAKVRVRGKAAKVRNGKWTMPVTLSKGENSFRVLATRKGHVKSSTVVSVTRELSAAERAVIRREEAARRAAKRREEAARRAGRRALESAQSYLAMSGFSKQGLFEQLSSSAGEGFTQAEAQYAVDHVDADWNREAVESARSYLEMSPMSRDGLIQQLSSPAGEGFTLEQATYAVNKVY
jgi:hypothetical protein